MNPIRAQLALVSQASRRLNTTLPSPVTEAVTAGDRLIASAQQVSGAPMIDAALNAIEAGKDPVTDKTVAGQSIGHILSAAGLVGAARTRADLRVEQALLDHTDEVLTGWHQALRPSSAALQEAAEVLPDVTLDVVMQQLRHDDPHALSLYANARRAVQVWAAAVQGLTQLLAAHHITVNDRRLLYTPDADAAALPPAADTWAVVRAGLTLNPPATLNDWHERAEAQQRRVLDEQQRRAATTTAEDQDQPTRSWGAVRLR